MKIYFGDEAVELTEEEFSEFQESIPSILTPEITSSTPGIRPTLWAVAYGVKVSDSNIKNITIASVISAAIYIDVGVYWVFLEENINPDLYFPKVTDDVTRMKVTEKYDNYFVINASDVVGNPVDPETFDIEIVRFV